ncbi:RNA-directed DNA polymerase, eukaryota, reverse transcriptase zinc-binding domain protein [Tanacetum coccineum]|uniref:RNA-directed DNA polymerase, eukaryota, reverse transcriptase zinc-binding domain protein n=1 Tax=Tanacetum coccineum TaxID=301880 RepID=A0ABQ4ZJK0_9ASTR
MLAKWWWRFHIEPNALWCKVIKSIHGPSGGLHDNSNLKANSGLWYHIMKLKDDLATLEINLSSLFMKKVENGNDTSFWHDKWMDGDPLCASFPRLYRLESNKCCCVSDRCPTPRGYDIEPLIVDFGPLGLDNPPGLNFHWAWCRSIRSINEVEEHNNLVSILTILHLYVTEDTWVCSIDSSRKFSVRGMINLIIIAHHTLVPSSPTRWNNISPAKININSWRVLNKRLPTRINLDRMGVDLDSVRCPMCDEDVEMKDHVFVSCKIATDNWKEVAKWWKIPYDSSFHLHDVIHMAENTIISPKLVKFLDVVVETPIWITMKFRNNMVFSKKRLSKNLLLNDIKLMSYAWVSSRYRKACLNWLEWLIYPCNAISFSCNSS